MFDVSELEQLDHIVGEVDQFERKLGVRWCRRCGRALCTTDGNALVGASKPCARVGVGARALGAELTRADR